MKKNSIMKKALSVFLTFVMVFTVMSVGIIVPQTKIEAQAAEVTINVNSLQALKDAVNTANTNGTKTVIKLTGNINGGNENAINIKGNVVIDFNGCTLSFTHQKTDFHNYDSNNKEYQLPKELQTNNTIMDNPGNGMLNVNEGATLQFINSSATAGGFSVKTHIASTNDNGRHFWSQGKVVTWYTSTASAVYAKGNVIVGDMNNAALNNFTISAQAKAGADDNGYDKKCMTTNAYALTLDGSSTLKMYGGELKAVCNPQSTFNGHLEVRCFTLNAVSCNSADIYGGSINMPFVEQSGLVNADSNASDAVNANFYTIRSATPNLFIFDVDCYLKMEIRENTGKKNTCYSSNVYATAAENAPYIYGGDFVNESNKRGKDSTSSCQADFSTIYNYYKKAIDGTINPNNAISGKVTGAQHFKTLFIFGDEVTENGINPWQYPTFRDYLAAYDANKDRYYGSVSILTWINDGTSYSDSSASYLRTGYTQTAWQGKTSPGGAFNSLYTSTGGAGLDASNGGSLYLFPVWTINTYTITYDLNDNDGGLTKAVRTPDCPERYKITDKTTLGTPKREGYTFTGWECTAISYPGTDTKHPWGQGLTYQAGKSLEGMNGDVTLKALWKVNDYKANFTLDGGNKGGNTADFQISYNVNKTFTFPDGILKDYYTFDGKWKCTAGDGNWAADSTLYASGDASPAAKYGNPTFTAQYTPVTYTVKYNSDGGSSVDDVNLLTYNIESTTSLPAVTRTGYKFVGWRAVSSDPAWSGTTVYPAGTSFLGKHGDVEFTAQWETATYKLTLDIKADEVFSGAAEYEYAYSSSLELNNPSKTGYTFKGWEVSAVSDEGATWAVGTVYTPDLITGKVTIPANKIGNVTLKATWEKVTYTVMYNSNGGTNCPNWNYTIEDSFNLPGTKKDGYTFLHWTVASNDGNWTATYNAGQTVSHMHGNATLSAVWTKTPYVITLNPNGGEVTPTSIGYDIESITDLPVPTRTAYDFKGWEISAIAIGSSWTAGDIYQDKLPAGNHGNITLKAIWEHKAYTIHYMTSGSNPGDLTYYIDSPEFRVSGSDYPGFEFIDWTVAANTGNWTKDEKITTDTVIKNRYGNVTLQANFRPVDYTITYMHKDGTNHVETYNMTTPISIDAYSVDGYDFGGWKVQSCEGGNWAAGSVFNPGDLGAGAYYGNVVFEPVLTAKNYTVKFISDGGTPYPDLSYTVESTDTLPLPEKTGYDFTGWTVTAANGNWTENEIVTAGTALTGKFGSVTLTAKWAPKLCNVTWVMGDRTEVTQVPYDSYPVFMGNTDKASDAQYDYTFKCWTPAPEIITGDATFTAIYDKHIRSYEVTFIVDTDEFGHQEITSGIYEYGQLPVYKDGAVPKKASSDENDHEWRFDKWSPELSTVTGAVTYTAQFKRLQAPRTVIWVINGTEHIEKWGIGETPVFSGVATKPDENGYKFVHTGWTPEIVPVVDGTDYRYEATFTPEVQTYSAEFDLKGGTLSYTPMHEYEMETGLELPDPTRAGYKFEGWKIVSTTGSWRTDTGNYTPGFWTNYWGDVKFEAVWTAITYKLTLNDPDGSAPEFIEYTIESMETVPDTVRKGYILSGWAVSTGAGNWRQGDTVQPGKSLNGMYGNVTLSAIWSAKPYTITWISGETVQTSEAYFGDPILPFDPISRMGYTAKWDKAIPEFMPEENITFTAVYTPIEYYLKFNVGGGTPVENFYYNIESAQALPTPTRDGSTFRGWVVTVGSGSFIRNTIIPGGTALKGCYGNATLTAKWEVGIHTITWVAGDTTRVTRWFYGTMPSYDGTPFKSPDDTHSYVFTGWDKPIETVTGDATYTALFEATERIYTVTWNVDGVSTVTKHKFGETPVYPGNTPERAETPEYIFEFAGWAPEVSPVNKDVTYVAQFNVFTKLLGLRVDKSAVFIDIGENAVISAIISPSTASTKDVKWSSSDPSVATVDEMGKVTGVNAGQAVICVQSADGAFKSFAVATVAPVITEYVVISAGGVSTTRLPGEAIQLTATVMPENATNKNVTWSSSDPSIAMVDPNTGMVIFGDITGTATITAVCDGYASGTIEVTTTEKSEEVKDTVPSHSVIFVASSCNFIIAGKEYRSIHVVYPEGATVEFMLAKPHFCMINGVQTLREPDGVYRIHNINESYHVIATAELDSGFAPDGEDPNQGSPNDNPFRGFFKMLQDFFRRIVEFFRGIFG